MGQRISKLTYNSDEEKCEHECECESPPSCPPGHISEIINPNDPESCHGPCQMTAACPRFDSAACIDRGGKIQKVGPCSYCEEMCPVLKEFVQKEPMTIFVQSAPVREKPVMLTDNPVKN